MKYISKKPLAPRPWIANTVYWSKSSMKPHRYSRRKNSDGPRECFPASQWNMFTFFTEAKRCLAWHQQCMDFSQYFRDYLKRNNRALWLLSVFVTSVFCLSYLSVLLHIQSATCYSSEAAHLCKTSSRNTHTSGWVSKSLSCSHFTLVFRESV